MKRCTGNSVLVLWREICFNPAEGLHLCLTVVWHCLLHFKGSFKCILFFPGKKYGTIQLSAHMSLDCLWQDSASPLTHGTKKGKGRTFSMAAHLQDCLILCSINTRKLSWPIQSIHTEWVKKAGIFLKCCMCKVWQWLLFADRWWGGKEKDPTSAGEEALRVGSTSCWKLSRAGEDVTAEQSQRKEVWGNIS